jgi:NAD(P)-dependent dehydrogenase (short-subunit alcohol dehydrogenase family)
MLPDWGLKGQVVIVAGAGGGGIGTAVCKVLADVGARVAALDVDPTKLENAKAVIGPSGSAIVADVCDGAEVDEALTLVGELGPLRGLVHVAGGIRDDQWSSLLRMDPVVFREVIEQNLISSMLTSQAVARRLAQAKTAGSIVLTSSIMATQAQPFGSHYAASKAALNSLARTAALEWGNHQIRVNAVAPGAVLTQKYAVQVSEATESFQKTAIPLGRRVSPFDVAHAALFLVSDLANSITGQSLLVDGGSSVRSSLLDQANIPFVVQDPAIRDRILKDRGTLT